MSRKKTISSDDSDLFRQTVGNVQAVKQDKVSLHEQRKPKPKPYPKPLVVNFDAHLSSRNPDEIETVGIYDSMNFLSAGLQNSVLKKLRRGFFGIDAEIDLHGLNTPDAKRQLLHFLHNSVEEGGRCVHIVHGKGYRSLDNVPVIKNELNRWLRQHKDVQAFCSASPKDGGTGALLVLLRLSDKYGFESMEELYE
ncbi:MAG: Smr/MutS family protein [Methylococcales bacterium]|nr:Smr/MutS family protein [Methylococcales bacterium]MDD5753300.1 Smr/MutS family protein [Methylococcales bacterium]